MALSLGLSAMAAAFIWAASAIASEEKARFPIPSITKDAQRPVFEGRWDFMPIIAPDSLPAKVAVTPDGAIWIASNGGVLRGADGESAAIIERWVDGRPDPAPSIISYDMIVLDEKRVLVSTIWREIYAVGPEGIEEINPRDIRGGFSFANLPDGRLAVGLDDFRLEEDFPDKIEAKLSREIVVIRDVERLVVSNGTLIAIRNGMLFQFDPATGEEIHSFAYSNRSDGIASARAMQDGRIMIATTPHYGTGGCFIVDPSVPTQTNSIFDGPCYDLIELDNGDVWASTIEGVFRLFGGSWQKYFSNQVNGIGRAGKFATTEAGSLWTATSAGLWRHYLHTKAVPAPDTGWLSTLHRDGSGRLLAGYESGAVYIKEENKWRTLLPSEEQNTYSRLPLFHDLLDGGIAILHPSGLFQLDETGLTRIADAPAVSTSSSPASYAICPNGSMFVGLAWSSTVLQLVEGRWIPDHELNQAEGGNAISDLACDSSGNLWALSTKTVGLRDSDGQWFETTPFPLRGNAKGNLFGALLPHENKLGVTVWGPWGYAVAIQAEGDLLKSRKIGISAELPYVFRDALRVGEKEIVLTNNGIYLWQDEALSRLPLVQEQLQRVVTAIAANEDTSSAFGFGIDVGADRALFSVLPRRYSPELLATFPKELSVIGPSTRLRFLLDGRAYPAADGRLSISFEPPLPKNALSIGSDGTVIVTDLRPDLEYRYRAQFVDAAGQLSNPVLGSLLYDRPFWQNPLVWAACTLLFLFSLFLMARSPIFLDIVLRRFGRRRWQVVLGTVDRRIELYCDEKGRLCSNLSAEGATLNLGARSKCVLPKVRLEELVRNMTGLALASNTPSGQQNFTNELKTLSRELNDALPRELCFELQSIEPGRNVLLEISRDLSGLPWDMMQGRDAQPLFASTITSRVVRTDRFASHPGMDGMMTAAIFVADSTGAEQAIWHDERENVSQALHSSGVLRVKTPKGREGIQSLEDWLDGSDIIHLVGHASADHGSGGSARFWYGHGLAIDEDRLRNALSRVKQPPALVFMNACGTLEQGNDLGGAALAGLATPFLEIGSTFVGTHWPVQTAFASELAVEFYTRVLPPPNALLWRWLRRRPLDGQSFAWALAGARRSLLYRSPATDPTWSAYAFFGEPTARLSLT